MSFAPSPPISNITSACNSYLKIFQIWFCVAVELGNLYVNLTFVFCGVFWNFFTKKLSKQIAGYIIIINHTNKSYHALLYFHAVSIIGHSSHKSSRWLNITGNDSNDHEVEFLHEIKIAIFHEVEIMIVRSKLV